VTVAKLKILMINYEFPPIGGGAANAHLCILKEYAKMPELEVDVLTSAPRPGFFKEKFAETIALYKVGLHKKKLHYWRKKEIIEWLINAGSPYRRLLGENNYDLVHSFSAFPSGYFCYKSSGRLPCIISLRGSDVPGYNVRLGLDYKLLRGLFRKIWLSASAVVTNSEGLKKLALDFMPELEILVITNGVDTKCFWPTVDKTIGGRIKLLTVSRLISRKRVDLLIEATAVLRSMGLDAVLSVAGQGDLMESLKALAERLGISDAVKFLGRVRPEKMPRLYRDNDIFVMSSLHEGMSNAMLEAMASGLPIVTTECEGVQELIDGNGSVVHKDDSLSIAREIEKIARSESVYKQMSATATARAGEFTWKTVALQYRKLYEKITAAGLESR
jgi:glycosyltransferase involved in cell wall biosynthesis